MLLLKNGVPWDVIEGMTPRQISACVIILGQLDGAEFNFQTMRWAKRE